MGTPSLSKDFVKPLLNVGTAYEERGKYISQSLNVMNPIFPYNWASLPYQEITYDPSGVFKVIFRCTEQDTPQRTIIMALCETISNAGFSTIFHDGEMDVIIGDNDQDVCEWDRLTLEINAGIVANRLFAPSSECQ